MSKTLLIVESPAKAKTIEKLLGSNYVVKSSFGHIRDLDKDKDSFGIDIANNFAPKYKIMATRTKQIKDIQDTIKNVNNVLLAADEDREGEAIAWHCAVVFKLPTTAMNRITFNEITKKALENAVANPRQIDMNMVNSQQARRILDRLVGFELSPVLWKHVRPELSAGRVQSVSLKIITDREDEINKFMDNKYFRTVGNFTEPYPLTAALNKNFELDVEVKEFLNKSNELSVIYTVEGIETKRGEKRPPPPYTTSSIQQDIGGRLGLASKMIMSILQKLYEAGMITYHRTDSTNLSSYAMEEAKKYINENIGEEYPHPRVYKTKAKCAQEAHEAIRPTYFNPELSEDFSDIEKKVYSIIFKRTVASQMKAYVYDTITMTIGISNNELKYTSSCERPIFDGYRRIYDDSIKTNTNENDDDIVAPPSTLFDNIKVGDVLTMAKIVSTEKYKTPPVRYTEASLIKKMEVLGIGRPSTYANIIETLLERNYVEKKDVQGKKVDTNEFSLIPSKSIIIKINKVSIGAEKKKLVPTEIGKITQDFLTKNFNDVVNYDFTNQMENRLDIIASGEQEWTNVVGDFYSLFHPNVALLSSTPSEREKEGNVDGTNISKRFLGNHNGKNIYTYVAKYGPVIQIGDDKDKKYVKLDDIYDWKTVTFEQAINIAPKSVGNYNGHDIIIKNGKYGYYFTHADKNYSIKTENIEEFTLEEAIKILNPDTKSASSSETSSLSGIETSTTTSTNQNVKSLGDYHIKIGKYGPYILFNSKCYKIPNEYQPDKLTKTDCKKIIDAKKEPNTNAVTTTSVTKAKATTSKKVKK